MEDEYIELYKIIVGNPFRTIWKAEYPIPNAVLVYTIPVELITPFYSEEKDSILIGVNKKHLCLEATPSEMCIDKIIGEVIYVDFGERPTVCILFVEVSIIDANIDLSPNFEIDLEGGEGCNLYEIIQSSL